MMVDKERSKSFKFNKLIFSGKKKNSKPRKCRKKLQDRFNDNGENCENSVLNEFNSNTIFQTTAEKINKGINSIRTSLNNLSQRFRGIRRKRILEETMNMPGCSQFTPDSVMRLNSGRREIELFTPFQIETPESTRRPETTQEPDLNCTPMFKKTKKSDNKTLLKEKGSNRSKLRHLLLMR